MLVSPTSVVTRKEKYETQQIHQIRAHCAPDYFGATLLRSGLNKSLAQSKGENIHESDRRKKDSRCKTHSGQHRWRFRRSVIFSRAQIHIGA
jgi:hypothetical protein